MKPARLHVSASMLWCGLTTKVKATYGAVMSATCCAALQEVFPPEVRKYLERLSGLEPVQKGMAQALGKKGIVLQPQQTGHAAPKVPIEGEFFAAGILHLWLCVQNVHSGLASIAAGG